MSILSERSDFTYHTVQYDGIDVLVIVDLDSGCMSVTNNVEAVVASIADKLGSQILGNPIIYRDSEGTYDGIDLKTSPPFYLLWEEEEEKAIRKAAAKYRRGITT